MVANLRDDMSMENYSKKIIFGGSRGNFLMFKTQLRAEIFKQSIFGALANKAPYENFNFGGGVYFSDSESDSDSGSDTDIELPTQAYVTPAETRSKAKSRSLGRSYQGLHCGRRRRSQVYSKLDQLARRRRKDERRLALKQ